MTEIDAERMMADWAFELGLLMGVAVNRDAALDKLNRIEAQMQAAESRSFARALEYLLAMKAARKGAGLPAYGD